MADELTDTEGLRLIAWSLEGGNVKMADECRRAADEIVRLRAEVERKADYAERMDALAEERLIALNAAVAEVERLTVESEEWDADTERNVARMAGLLHDTANALHGGPLSGGMWSWHDLPAIATAERALADQLAVALLGTASGRIIPTDDEWAGVVKMRSAALDAWEARRG